MEEFAELKACFPPRFESAWVVSGGGGVFQQRIAGVDSVAGERRLRPDDYIPPCVSAQARSGKIGKKCRDIVASYPL